MGWDGIEEARRSETRRGGVAKGPSLAFFPSLLLATSRLWIVIGDIRIRDLFGRRASLETIMRACVWGCAGLAALHVCVVCIVCIGLYCMCGARAHQLWSLESEGPM